MLNKRFKLVIRDAKGTCGSVPNQMPWTNEALVNLICFKPNVESKKDD